MLIWLIHLIAYEFINNCSLQKYCFSERHYNDNLHNCNNNQIKFISKTHEQRTFHYHQLCQLHSLSPKMYLSMANNVFFLDFVLFNLFFFWFLFSLQSVTGIVHLNRKCLNNHESQNSCSATDVLLCGTQWHKALSVQVLGINIYELDWSYF